MRVRFTTFLGFVCLTLQTQNCSQYDRAMQAGNHFFQKTNCDSTLVQFQIAQIAARECRETTDLPAKQLGKYSRAWKITGDEAKVQQDLAVVQKEAEVQKSNCLPKVKEATTEREANQKQLAKHTWTVARFIPETAKQRSPGLTRRRELSQVWINSSSGTCWLMGETFSLYSPG